MWEDKKEWTFSTGGSVLMDYRLAFWSDAKVLKLERLNDELISYKQKAFDFTRHQLNWKTEVMWIIVMFLSTVWLFLTAPIHCRASTGEQVMQC